MASRRALGGFAILAWACGPVDEPVPRPVEPIAPAENRLEAPAPNEDGLLRVLVFYDMEGLSSQNDPYTTDFSHPEPYALGRQYLIADVNAVVAGLFEAGADEVHVVDGHGSGNPEPDLPVEELDPRATMVFREAPFRLYVDLAEAGVYDAVAVVGMHAKTGSGGFASHTYDLGIEWRLNGRSITEAEIVGFSFGRVGTPVVFVSGDDRLADDLETMPWIEFVAVKKSTSASTADLRPADEAHEELRLGARRALESREAAKAMKIGTPIKAAIHAVPPANLEILDGVPGIQYEDEIVTFVAANFEEAYDGLVALIGVARTGYSSLLIEAVRDHPDGQALMQSSWDRTFERWLDVESGHWSPPDSALPLEGRRYHGAP